MEKSTYEVEEMILAMVNIALENENLKRKNYELEEGCVISIDRENESIKKRMFEVILRSLFNDSNCDNVLLSVIDCMNEPVEV